MKCACKQKSSRQNMSDVLGTMRQQECDKSQFNKSDAKKSLADILLCRSKQKRAIHGNTLLNRHIINSKCFSEQTKKKYQHLKSIKEIFKSQLLPSLKKSFQLTSLLPVPKVTARSFSLAAFRILNTDNTVTNNEIITVMKRIVP